MRASVRILGAVLFALCCIDAFVWYAAVAEDHRGVLTVSFLRGGAVFIAAPSGRQVLIDGGADDSVARQLGSFMPLYDRSIDLVIARAPEPARTNGLVGILARHQVSYLVQSTARSGAPQEAAFDAAVSRAEAGGMRVVEAARGQVIDLGSGAYIQTLFPDRRAAGIGARDGCLILKLTYGRNSFLLSCGSPTIESYVAMLDGAALASDVLYASANASALFVGFVNPQFAVAADQCGATNGNAAAFERFSLPVADTCTGPVTFVSDARTVWKE